MSLIILEGSKFAYSTFSTFKKFHPLKFVQSEHCYLLKYENIIVEKVENRELQYRHKDKQTGFSIFYITLIKFGSTETKAYKLYDNNTTSRDENDCREN